MNIVDQLKLVRKGNKVIYNNVPYPEGRFKKGLTGFLKDANHPEATKYRLMQIDEPEAYDKIISELFYSIEEVQEEVILPPVSQALEEIIDSHIPIQDVLSGDNHLLHSDTRLISPVDFSVYKSFFNQKEWEMVKKEIDPFIVKYSVKPLELDGYITYNTGPKKFPQVNSYLPPRWTFEENKKEGLFKEHQRMIFSRFANAEMRERYFCALYHMMNDRNKNIPMLVHKREGTGKSTVMGFIPGNLVGMENTSYTDKNFMASPHKDAFLNKRMVFLDEHRLVKSQVAIEKQFVEDMLYINPKGKASMTIPNTISFFAASNEIGDIYTEPTNRRHYFLEDSGRHIIEEFGLEFMQDYKSRMTNDPAFVANLGHWVLNNFKDYKYAPDAVYHGPTFEQVVRATSFHYYDELINQLEEGEEVSYIFSKSQYNKKHRTGNRGEYFPRLQTFTDFFKNFTWNGKPVCTIEHDAVDNDLILKPLE